MGRPIPKLTDRLPLGAKHLSVSPFCLARVGSPAVISAAYDAGINFFFLSADMHWPLYEATRCGIADLLKRNRSIRDDIVVGVVSYMTQPEFCAMPFQETLDSVPGLERLDLAIAGGAYSGEILTRFPIYDGYRRSGRFGTKAIGVTFHDRVAASVASRYGLLDIAFIRYNPQHPGARKDLFPLLSEDSPTLLFNFTSTGGYLDPSKYKALGLSRKNWIPKATDYYRFALSRPEIDGILCAFGSPSYVADLVKAM